MTDAERYRAFVRENAGLAVSAAYLAATAVGMLSSWTFYQEFDINVFHYAQLGDFLLAAVRTPLATFAILLAIPAVWVILASDEWATRRFPRYKRLYGTEALYRWSRSPTAMLIYFLLYAFVFSVLYSSWMGSRVRGGQGATVSAQLQAGTYLGRDATRPFEAVLLGTTSSFVFLYDQATETATVVPLENLAALTPRSGDGSEP